MSEFFVGQKVVCVRGNIRPNGFGNEILPEDGAVYTIRGILPCTDGDGCGFHLVEIVNQPQPYSGAEVECNFHQRVFRPLEEKPDSIELFREIARGVSDGKPIIEDAEYRLPTPEKVRA